MISIAISIVIFFTFFYYFISKNHSYWKSKGVPQLKPLPFLGDTWPMVLSKQSSVDFFKSIYKATAGKRYAGIYQGMKPTLLVRDPDLIKKIVVKDFDSFVNHSVYITEEADPHFTKNLFMIKDQRWRDMRSTLSPSFSTGKIRHMFPLIAECAESFVEFLSGSTKAESGLKTVEMREISEKFTTNAIASTAYGIKIDSLKDEKNEFYQQSLEMAVFSFWQKIKITCYFTKSFLTDVLLFFKCSIFSRSIYKFFDEMVSETISEREVKGITRPDMIQLLMRARDKNQIDGKPQQEDGKKLDKNIEIGMKDIAAQAFIFFVGGFSTTSTLLSFMIHELTVNQDVQERLREEVLEVLKKNDGKLDYADLMGMKYLDMVISETLRKWPPASNLDRLVTKPYVIEPERPDEKPVHLKVGDVVWIPVSGIHSDPEFYPEPDRFAPERFSEENKASVKPYSYLPFGVGPRMCIGNRWALLVAKITAFYLINNFEFVPVERTENPLKLGSGFFPYAENGIWVGIKSLKQ